MELEKYPRAVLKGLVYDTLKNMGFILNDIIQFTHEEYPAAADPASFYHVLFKSTFFKIN